MKNCVGVADFLCAYADNELPESHRQIVEDHISICENCSAILDIYREISVSVSETNVPVPEALRVGVMNRIQNERIPQEIDNNRQRRQYKYILTRFAPIAACLVVGLVVWQFWGTLWGTNNEGMRIQSNAPPAPAAAPAPEAAMPAPAAPADAAPEAMWDSLEAPAAEAEVQMDAASAYGLDIDDDESESVPAPGGRVPQTGGSADWLQQLYDNIDGFGPLDSADERLFRDAYAVIALTGDLPVILAEYEPSPDWQYGRFGWEMLYVIPIPKVADLLEEVDGHEYLEVVFNNTNNAGNFALVLLSYGL